MSVPLRAGDTVIYVEDREGIIMRFLGLDFTQYVPFNSKVIPKQIFCGISRKNLTNLGNGYEK